MENTADKKIDGDIKITVDVKEETFTEAILNWFKSSDTVPPVLPKRKEDPKIDQNLKVGKVVETTWTEKLSTKIDDWKKEKIAEITKDAIDEAKTQDPNLAGALSLMSKINDCVDYVKDSKSTQVGIASSIGGCVATTLIYAKTKDYKEAMVGGLLTSCIAPFFAYMAKNLVELGEVRANVFNEIPVTTDGIAVGQIPSAFDLDESTRLSCLAALSGVAGVTLSGALAYKVYLILRSTHEAEEKSVMSVICDVLMSAAALIGLVGVVVDTNLVKSVVSTSTAIKKAIETFSTGSKIIENLSTWEVDFSEEERDNVKKHLEWQTWFDLLRMTADEYNKGRQQGAIIKADFVGYGPQYAVYPQEYGYHIDEFMKEATYKKFLEGERELLFITEQDGRNRIFKCEDKPPPVKDERMMKVFTSFDVIKLKCIDAASAVCEHITVGRVAFAATFLAGIAGITAAVYCVDSLLNEPCLREATTGYRAIEPAPIITEFVKPNHNDDSSDEESESREYSDEGGHKKKGVTKGQRIHANKVRDAQKVQEDEDREYRFNKRNMTEDDFNDWEDKRRGARRARIPEKRLPKFLKTERLRDIIHGKLNDLENERTKEYQQMSVQEQLSERQRLSQKLKDFSDNLAKFYGMGDMVEADDSTILRQLQSDVSLLIDAVYFKMGETPKVRVSNEVTKEDLENIVNKDIPHLSNVAQKHLDKGKEEAQMKETSIEFVKTLQPQKEAKELKPASAVVSALKLQPKNCRTCSILCHPKKIHQRLVVRNYCDECVGKYKAQKKDESQTVKPKASVSVCVDCKSQLSEWALENKKPRCSPCHKKVPRKVCSECNSEMKGDAAKHKLCSKCHVVVMKKLLVNKQNETSPVEKKKVKRVRTRKSKNEAGEKHPSKGENESASTYIPSPADAKEHRSLVSLYNPHSTHPQGYFGCMVKVKHNNKVYFAINQHQLQKGVYIKVENGKNVPLPDIGKWKIFRENGESDSIFMIEVDALPSIPNTHAVPIAACGTPHGIYTMYSRDPATMRNQVCPTEGIVDGPWIKHSASTAPNYCGAFLFDAKRLVAVGIHCKTAGPSTHGSNNACVHFF